MHYKYSGRSGYRQYCNHDQDIKLNKFNVFVCGLVSLTTVSTLTLLSSTVSADTTNVNTISTTVPPSCSFTSASTSSYGATILNGQSTTITADPITVTCNDTAGYAVYAIGYSGDTYTGDYHTDMISTLNNSYNIKTNGTSGASYWKMELQNPSNATIANSYDNFQTIPASLTKIASYTSNTQAGSFTPVYQIYIATTQAAGTYTGKVKYTLVHPNTMVAGTFTLAYDANGGTGTMSSNTNLYNFEEFTLPTNTITAPSGYRFAGWCTAQDQNQNPQTTCTGTSYADGDTLPTSLTWAGGTATLYAYWEEKLYMQDITLANCPTTITTVYDKRDETPYRIQKLADNKCWMLDNLALDLTALTQAQLYGTGTDAGKMTNASNEALGYLKGATTGTDSNKWAMAAVTKNWTTSYSFSQPWIAVDSDTSSVCDNAYCVNDPTSGEWSSSSVTQATINNTTSIVQGKIGVYYNYCAASAGSYCWGNGTSSTGSPESDPVSGSLRDITDDICPYRWRLPTGGSGGEFQALYSQYSSGSPNQVTAFQTALSTPLSGNFDSGKAYYQGSYGYSWSSTWYDNNYMHILYVDSSSVNSSGSLNRRYGRSVRCILAE